MFIYELACVHAMRLTWEAAVPIFEKLVAEPSFRVRGVAALQLIGCYKMLGQDDKALELMKRMPTIARKMSPGGFDQHALKLSQRYIPNGGHFAAFEILYVRRDFDKMKQVMEQALALLDKQAARAGVLQQAPSESPAPSPSSSSSTSAVSTQTVPATAETTPQPQQEQSDKAKFLEGLKSLRAAMASIGSGNTSSGERTATEALSEGRASYLLLRGAMLKYHHGLSNELAAECFTKVVALQPELSDTYKWLVPYAWFELCESRFHQGNPQAAVAALKKATGFKDFLWEDPLKMRARITADQLKHGDL